MQMGCGCSRSADRNLHTFFQMSTSFIHFFFVFKKRKSIVTWRRCECRSWSFTGIRIGFATSKVHVSCTKWPWLRISSWRCLRVPCTTCTLNRKTCGKKVLWWDNRELGKFTKINFWFCYSLDRHSGLDHKTSGGYLNSTKYSLVCFQLVIS